MSIQEIDALWNTRNHPDLVIDEITRSYSAGATFELGVDKLKIGYQVTINCGNSICLRPDTEQVKQERDQTLAEIDFDVFKEYGMPVSYRVIICPDTTQAGVIDKTGGHIIFYVSHEEFTVFCQEAEQIFNEYSVRGMSFYMIPDIWFSDAFLVRFIREQMRPYPAMSQWFTRDANLPGPFGRQWSRSLT